MGLRADIATFAGICRNAGFWRGCNDAVKALAWRHFPPLRAQAARVAEMQRQDAAWDTAMGVATCGDTQLEASGVPAQEARRGNSTYRPINSDLFTAAIAQVAIDHSQYSFVDFGSGKGKALMLAAEYPFREVVGVEYAPGLHAVALRNLSLYAGPRQRCRAIRSELGDALQFTPPLTPLLCFFFNPFDRGTLHGVICRLKEDWQANPRPVILLYVNWRNIEERLGTFQAEASLRALHLSRYVGAFQFFAGANPLWVK